MFLLYVMSLYTSIIRNRQLECVGYTCIIIQRGTCAQKGIIYLCLSKMSANYLLIKRMYVYEYGSYENGKYRQKMIKSKTDSHQNRKIIGF